MNDEEKKVEGMDETVQSPKRRRRRKKVQPDISEQIVDLNQDSELEDIELEDVSDVGPDTEWEEHSDEEIPKAQHKRKRKKKKKMEPEDSESDEEGGDSWLDADGGDLFDDDTEHHTGRGMKILLITLASVFGVIAAVYLGFSVFFMNHFYFFTTVNDINFSMKSEKYVTDYIKKQVSDYSLTIEEKGDVKETISGADIDLKYVENDDVKNAIKSQNAFLWPKALFVKSSTKITVDVNYDKDKLQTQLNNLKAVTAADQTEPASAYPKYANGTYTIEPEVLGTKVDTTRLTEEANLYVSGFKNDLNMEEDNCYLMPAYTADSEEVKTACDTMNKYIKASITYDMSPNTEVVNADLISTWLSVDGNMQVTFNTDAVKQYMADLAARYDTVGATRTITTPGGKTAEVSGGTYGWSIDEETAAAALIASIQNGEVTTKTPEYEQTAATHDAADWGTTYLEVDLSSQHMWYVVNGGVALETDVVTGDGNDSNKITPSGVYQILETQSPSILKGEIQASTGKPEYETEVQYWMRVTWSGIGFHDATWQSAFGGSRFVNGFGSHGCINMPYDVAGSLYNQLAVGTPVIIHY